MWLLRKSGCAGPQEEMAWEDGKEMERQVVEICLTALPQADRSSQVCPGLRNPSVQTEMALGKCG